MPAVLERPKSGAKIPPVRSKAPAPLTPHTNDPHDGSGAIGYPTPGPELILFVNDPHMLLAAGSSGARDRAAAPAFGAGGGLRALLAEESADAEPLFDVSDKGAKSSASIPLKPAAEAPAMTTRGEESQEAVNLQAAFRVSVPPERAARLLKRLSEDDEVDGVFLKPAAEPATAPRLNAMAPSAASPTPITPDFSPMQRYLNPAADGGVDARYAWTLPGGRGDNVKIIDLEGEWRYSHEVLSKVDPKLLGGQLANNLGWRNHGTAVAGVIAACGSGSGIIGICPNASLRTISTFGSTRWSSARAIRQAALKLRPGDILLIELHRPGPRFNFTSRPADQKGYIAIEWWPDDFAAIRDATRRGVIVVAAAGNGEQDLDDPLYNNGPIHGRFPKWWQNPFARQKLDSGSVLAGAGAPPSGNYGADRSRLDFSNFGQCVDCQGWGREVVTTGYGDLQGGASEDRWYSSDFSGTSSASPIIVGTLACAQGILRRAKRQPLTPSLARGILRSGGSPQQPTPTAPLTQRIGPRPDLNLILPNLLSAQPPKPAQAKTRVIKAPRRS